MNEKIKSTVRNFMSIVKDTEEYRNYSREKERVMKHPELKRRIDEFRIRNYEVQNFSDEEELFEQMELFEAQYSSFCEEPMVDDFLSAELAFCRMMQEINIEITEALEFDLEVTV